MIPPHTAPLSVHRLPRSWRPGSRAGEFVAVSVSIGEEHAVVSVRPAQAPDPDYLLARHGAEVAGAFGRPVVRSLPDLLADGVSIVAFDASPDGSLRSRIDLVRRAWDLDIAVTARGVAVENVDVLFSDMLDLLWEIRPEGEAL